MATKIVIQCRQCWSESVVIRIEADEGLIIPIKEMCKITCAPVDLDYENAESDYGNRIDMTSGDNLYCLDCEKYVEVKVKEVNIVDDPDWKTA